MNPRSDVGCKPAAVSGVGLKSSRTITRRRGGPRFQAEGLEKISGGGGVRKKKMLLSLENACHS